MRNLHPQAFVKNQSGP